MSWSARAARRGADPRPPHASSLGVMEMDAPRRRWLEELLTACANSGRLNGWEIEFTSGIGRRLAVQGEKMALTREQFAVLSKIDERVHAAG